MDKFQFTPCGLAMSQFNPQSFICYIFSPILWSLRTKKKTIRVLFKLIDFIFCGQIQAKLSKFNCEREILVIKSCKNFHAIKKKYMKSILWYYISNCWSHAIERNRGPTLKTSPSTKRLLECWSTNLISSNTIFFYLLFGFGSQPGPVHKFVEEKVQLQGNRQVVMMKFTTSFLPCHYNFTSKPLPWLFEIIFLIGTI